MEKCMGCSPEICPAPGGRCHERIGYDSRAFAYYFPKEFGGHLILNTSDVAWKITDRLRNGYEHVALYRKA